MDSLTGLAPAGGQEAATCAPPPKVGRRWGLPQLVLGLPLTVLMVLVLLLLALPDILRPKAGRWDRYGDY